jgi:hypothetical protein
LIIRIFKTCEGENMGFCNSCGRPVYKGNFGTNEDGSENEDYCKDCFQNGEFTEPDINVNEMIIKVAKQMIEKHQEYIVENGVDLDEIANWNWNE